jgi:hypothetical protein
VISLLGAAWSCYSPAPEPRLRGPWHVGDFPASKNRRVPARRTDYRRRPSAARSRTCSTTTALA